MIRRLSQYSPGSKILKIFTFRFSVQVLKNQNYNHENFKICFCLDLAKQGVNFRAVFARWIKGQAPPKIFKTSKIYRLFRKKIDKKINIVETLKVKFSVTSRKSRQIEFTLARRGTRLTLKSPTWSNLITKVNFEICRFTELIHSKFFGKIMKNKILGLKFSGSDKLSKLGRIPSPTE